MLYSSTRGNDNDVNFSQVMLNGLAKDGGLYVPNFIPKISKKKLQELKNLSYEDLAYEVTKDFVLSKDISKDDYKLILKKTYSKKFGDKIVTIDKLNNNEFILNLFHGPTFAFKDYALQLLGNLYDFILKKKKLKLTIIGATSGDTGSAAIYGCSKSEKVDMFILFPKDKVSEVQRKQMTTFDASNVTNISVKGNFDDCQKLVKDLFKKNTKSMEYNFAAINSINWVRILGQIIYYFWSYFKVEKNMTPINYVVPTGNFGNVYAGFISKRMGLPIKKLIVCSNKNDILTRFFSNGIMKKKNTRESLTPSMDIQVSSNFERLLHHFLKDSKKVSYLMEKMDKNGQYSVPQKLLIEILKEFEGGSISDDKIKKAIKKIYDNFNIITDPHTAVGYSVGKKILKNDEKRVYLSTAHFSKFFNTVSDSLKINLIYPQKLKEILEKKEQYLIISNQVDEIKKVIDEKTSKG
ncbi:MAG: threonine synthase [Rickettsiales bacterium]|nr:threonine synthase [Rickettsiales bacterium]